MYLYNNSASNFIDDINYNRLSGILENGFINYYGHRPAYSEITSWINSLQFIGNQISSNKLYDVYLAIEYELPYSSKRIDCIFFGYGKDNSKNVIITELKQWSSVKMSPIEGNVYVYISNGMRTEPHPSMQVRGYYNYLKDFMDVFYKNNLNLYACAYCHNYNDKNNILLNSEFAAYTDLFPLFIKNDAKKFGDYLLNKLNNGKGSNVFKDFIGSNIRPSRKLIDYTSDILRNQKVFSLVDDQITANNAIIDRAKKASKVKNKSVIIVSGGPGTGKSVIALNAMATLLSMNLSVYHATGSKAFTSALRNMVGENPSHLFNYFNSFKQTKENEINVLIADEAHRLRKTSNNRFTKIDQRSSKSQIEELINVAKVSVFFIDEHQVVRPEEIGSISMIKKTAQELNADIYEFELKSQFRCNGSDGYLNWIDTLLNIYDSGNVKLTDSDNMSFNIVDNPEDLRDIITMKNKENKNSARIIAGFCWPWSPPNEEGTLKNDIVINEFKATWEYKDSNVKLTSKPSTSPWYLWSIDDRCQYQVGSIYTVQGFEFDYIGLIWGNDLIYDNNIHDWVGKPENSYDSVVKRDKKNFNEHIKNIYRTLLSRARYGVYVYFVDEDTKNFVKSRIDINKIQQKQP